VTVALVLVGLAASAQTLTMPTYTAAQAEWGKQVFMAQCSSCHGDDLDNGQFGPPLAGPSFTAHWGSQTLDRPYSFMIAQMPPDNAGGLDPATYADLMAFILSNNDVPPGGTKLPSDIQKLKDMAAPK
jgi:mono/diheme cytochrome c family protein